MSKLFLVMNAQHAWELNQVYRDHVINEGGPALVVTQVMWRPLGVRGNGVAMIMLEAANAGSLREAGDARGLKQTGRQATTEEVHLAFGAEAGTGY